MSTMRSAILAASTLGANNILRDHLQNLNAGGGNIYVGGELTMNVGQSLSMDNDAQLLTMDIGQALTMDLDTNELSVSIDNELGMEF